MSPKALLVKATLVALGVGASAYRLNRFVLVLVFVIRVTLLFILRGPDAPHASLSKAAAGCALAAGK
jgi:hypothetical protein